MVSQTVICCAFAEVKNGSYTGELDSAVLHMFVMGSLTKSSVLNLFRSKTKNLSAKISFCSLKEKIKNNLLTHVNLTKP